MTRIAIIDYRCGNLFNLLKAFRYLGASQCEIVTDASRIQQFDKLVLPGVGSFKKGMENLTLAGFDQAIYRHVSDGKPLLGICAGLQLLMSSSEEFGHTKGLDLVQGQVVHLKQLARDERALVPHIGWAEVVPLGRDHMANADMPSKVRLLAGTEPHPLFYFAHSYGVAAVPDDVIYCKTPFYGGEFVSVIERQNVFAVQFHPELSGRAGLTVLNNFLKFSE